MIRLQLSSTLQAFLTAPTASFARRRSYGYASSQELTAGTRQKTFRYAERTGVES